MKGIVAVVGEKTRFCGPGCRDAFRSDRQHGLMYPAAPKADGGWESHQARAMRTGHCAYCWTDLKDDQLANATRAMGI